MRAFEAGGPTLIGATAQGRANPSARRIIYPPLFFLKSGISASFVGDFLTRKRAGLTVGPGARHPWRSVHAFAAAARPAPRSRPSRPSKPPTYWLNRRRAIASTYRSAVGNGRISEPFPL